MDDQVTGAELILAARRRQLDSEDAEHMEMFEDTQTNGELGAVAACYAMPEHARQLRAAEASGSIGPLLHALWPWNMQSWSPVQATEVPDPDQARIADLVQAGAMLSAEIDRLLRLQRRGR